MNTTKLTGPKKGTMRFAILYTVYHRGPQRFSTPEMTSIAHSLAEDGFMEFSGEVFSLTEYGKKWVEDTT